MLNDIFILKTVGSRRHKMLLLLPLLLLSGGLSRAYAQSGSEITVPNDTLTWALYSTRTETESEFWAGTFWHVYYRFKVVSIHVDTVKVDVETHHVLTKESWVLQGKESTELLRHEQLHFNTALLCELQFKKAIDSCTLLLPVYRQKIDSIFNFVLTRIVDLNRQYDKDTNHMRNRAQQALWDNRISEMLSDLRK
jgi:hypothetical protein